MSSHVKETEFDNSKEFSNFFNVLIHKCRPGILFSVKIQLDKLRDEGGNMQHLSNFVDGGNNNLIPGLTTNLSL